MSPARVHLTRAAAKDLDSLSSTDREHVIQDLRALADEPVGPPPRIKRLRGFDFPVYRLRSGDYRVLYRFDEAMVTVMRVINRRELERALRGLRLGQPRVRPLPPGSGESG